MYDRLYWRTRFLITCPRHAVFLRERCPACHAAIPSLRSSPTRCPTCGKGDYRAAPRSLHLFLPAASCLLAGDLLTLKALGVDGEPASSHLTPWQGEGLASFSPLQYFSLLHSICDSWPDHLFALFDALQLRSLHLSFGPSFEDYLPRLFIGREGDEAYSFLDQAYGRYESTFGWQGYAALVDRVQQRLNAFGDIPHASLRG